MSERAVRLHAAPHDATVTRNFHGKTMTGPHRRRRGLVHLEHYPVSLTQFRCVRGAAVRKASCAARCLCIGQARQHSGRPPRRNPKGQACLGQGGVKPLDHSSGYARRRFPGPDPNLLCRNG